MSTTIRESMPSPIAFLSSIVICTHVPIDLFPFGFKYWFAGLRKMTETPLRASVAPSGSRDRVRRCTALPLHPRVHARLPQTAFFGICNSKNYMYSRLPYWIEGVCEALLLPFMDHPNKSVVNGPVRYDLRSVWKQKREEELPKALRRRKSRGV